MKFNTNKRNKLKEFSLIFGIVFPLIFGFLIPLITSHPIRIWTLFFGLITISIGIINPLILNPIYEIWMKIGLLLGWINSRIILSLIFILILFPISLIMRLFRYDPLRKNKANLESYKEKRKDSSVDFTRVF